MRLAEEGDDLSCAGLVSRALDAYDRAAALFEDAYCVQWRLAERLRERGFPELAAPAPRRSAWEYRLSSFSGRDTLAARAFDAAAAFAEMDDPPTWLDALCTWLEAPSSR